MPHAKTGFIDLLSLPLVSAYSAPVPEVLDVIQEWGSIYILGGDRKVSLTIDVILS